MRLFCYNPELVICRDSGQSRGTGGLRLVASSQFSASSFEEIVRTWMFGGAQALRAIGVGRLRIRQSRSAECLYCTRVGELREPLVRALVGAAALSILVALAGCVNNHWVVDATMVLVNPFQLGPSF